MMKKKSVNKKASLQKIIDWGNRSIGHSINTEKLNEAMAKPDWEKTLIKMAKFCDVDVVYN